MVRQCCSEGLLGKVDRGNYEPWPLIPIAMPAERWSSFVKILRNVNMFVSGLIRPVISYDVKVPEAYISLHSGQVQGFSPFSSIGSKPVQRSVPF